VLVEMRSPRAVVHALVAVGNEPPPPLLRSLPERDPGPAAPLGEPGPEPPREALGPRFSRFEARERSAGALEVTRHVVPGGGRLRLTLPPGCHRLFASQSDDAPSYRLELRAAEGDPPQNLPSSARGDVHHELCLAQERLLLVSFSLAEGDPHSVDAQVALASAHFALPEGLPGRFGPEAVGAMALALGGASAPRRVGPLVAATLGAQGRTPLPRKLLARTCYIALATALHGQVRALSLGVRTGSTNAEATTSGASAGPRLGFCTGRDGQSELDVEARGLGVAWLMLLFQMGPAQSVQP